MTRWQDASDQSRIDAEILILLPFGMKLFPKILLSIVLGLALPQLHAAGQALSPLSHSIGGGEQFLVLKNGNLLQGLIEQKPPNFSVQTASGSRLIIAADTVDFVCDSLDQVYWERLIRIRATDSAALQNLFYWCLKHDRFSEAANQLEVLKATGLPERQLKFFNERLATTLAEHSAQTKPLRPDNDQPIQPQLAQATAVTATHDGQATLPSSDFFAVLDPVFQPLPSLTSNLEPSPTKLADRKAAAEVLQVAYAEPIQSAREATGQETANENLAPYVSPAVHDLERFVRELPSPTINHFRANIERWLIKECSDCHRSDFETMPLIHAGKLQSVSNRMTQRNLHSVLHWVDRNAPESSRLLTAAATAHGGAKVATWPAHSVEYERLVQWLSMFSQHPTDQQLDSPLKPNQPKKDSLTEPRLSPKATSEVSPKTAASRALHELSPRLTNPVSATLLPPTIGEIPMLNSKPSPFIPRDEFDPEIFNRQ